MANDSVGELADLRHDILAKCSNLKAAVVQLKGRSTADELELIRLMQDQARDVSDRLDAYARSRGVTDGK